MLLTKLATTIATRLCPIDCPETTTKFSVGRDFVSLFGFMETRYQPRMPSFGREISANVV